MRDAGSFHNGWDRVKITQLAAEPSGRPQESMSRKDAPPFGEGLAEGAPLPCHGGFPCPALSSSLAHS